MTRHDIVLAHYVFCSLHHEGQGSDRYARLSRITAYFQPGAAFSETRFFAEEEHRAAREVYLSLCRREGVTPACGDEAESDEPRKRCQLCRRPSEHKWSEVCESCFARLTPVRVFSRVGPCLTGYRIVRRNKKSVTVAWRNGGDSPGRGWLETERVHAVHETPCRSCKDHPESQYRDGFYD